jgi:hypothetical protein
MKPLYIFDLDGTLALTEHRQHFVEKPSKCSKRDGDPSKDCDCVLICKFKPDWTAFFAACVDDEPNKPVIDTLLRLVECGCDVWIWSGRSSEVMKQTQDWLADQLGGYGHGIPLCMRVEGDFTPDEDLKKAWLNDMTSYDRRRLVAVFDDRRKVVDMWRSIGVPCFQVAPGNF